MNKQMTIIEARKLLKKDQFEITDEELAQCLTSAELLKDVFFNFLIKKKFKYNQPKK